MKAITKLALVAAALLVGSAAYAQEIKVNDFRLDPKDKTACRKATAKKDASGKKCAVIKLVDGKETNYQAGTAAAVATQPALIYVSAQDKSVEIADSTLNAAITYEFPFALKAGKTYVMEIEEVPAPAPEPDPEVAAQQFVLFTVSPEQAIIELGEETVTARGGEAQKLLNVGHYKYKVSAKGFYPTEGEFDLADSAKVEVAVELRAANGWLNVLDKDEDLTGAAVFVDDEFVGNAPVLVSGLMNGPHKLMVAKEQYSNLIDTIVICDNDTLTIAPCLKPNFSVVTLTTAETAEIWANGEWKGTGTWTGKLLAGVYNFEAREIGYTSEVITGEVVVDPAGLEFTIPDPQPIYGNIVIMSFPAKASVFVDGQPVGVTPVYLPKVKYGIHKIELYKKGYKPYFEEVEMTESMRISVNPDLEALPEECAEKCCEEKPAEEPAECCEQKLSETPAPEVCCEKPAEASCCEEKPAEASCCEEKPAEEVKPACCCEKCECGENCCGKCGGEKCAEPCCEKPAEAPAEEPVETPEQPAEEPAPAEEPVETPEQPAPETPADPAEQPAE